MSTRNYCSSGGVRHTLGCLAGTTALLCSLGFSTPALAVITATATVGPSPTDNTLVVDQVISVRILLSNTSIDDALTPSGIPARFLAGSTITVKLACADGVCTIPLGGTLQFLPVGASGCESGTAFSSCAANGNNEVVMTLAQDIELAPGQLNLNVGSLSVQAKNPILTTVANPNGSFFMRAQSSIGGFEACSPDLNGTCAPGDAAGSTVLQFPGGCDVQVDKQVSCDGGTTWVDAGLVNAPTDDGANGCQALSTDSILVRYQVNNLGNLDASQCTLTDVNSVGGTPFGVPAYSNQTIAAGSISGFIPGTSAALCSTYGESEPNTATLTCNACGGVVEAGNPGLTAADSATFSCLSADLRVDRAVSCVAGVPAGFNDQTLVRANEDGTNGPTTLNGQQCTWQYQANNPGTAPLYDCVLTDSDPLVTPNPILVGNLAAGALVAPIPATNPVLCSDALEANEQPGGRVDLACCTRDVASLADCAEANRIQVYDLSTVTCDTPDFNVAKLCEVNTDTNAAAFTVTVTNTGQVPLQGCVATDTLHETGLCPQTGTGIDQGLSPASPFDLAYPGGVQVLTGGATLTGDSCNFVSVTCNTPAGDAITRTAQADCDVPAVGCLTRTPGFWATHPFIIEDLPASIDVKHGNVDRSLDLLPISICGTELTTTDAVASTVKKPACNYSGDSTSEAMCSVGTDGKCLSDNLVQLIRQCTAATLNVKASQDLGGDCSSDYPAITALLTNCCGSESICTGDAVAGYSIGSCISDLDTFNNLPNDSLNFPFNTGPADPTSCQNAKNNGVVVSPR